MRPLEQERTAKLKELAARVPAEKLFPVVEAMFLMAAVDGDVSQAEARELGRSLAPLFGSLSEGDVEGLLADHAARLDEDGWETRVAAVAKDVRGTELAEVAYRLAVSVALADDFVVGAESQAMDEMADAFGVDQDRAHALVREVYDELFG